MRLTRHGKGRQAPQSVGAHQGDSRTKGTRCVPLRTSRSSRRRHISACSPCLPPRDRLGGEDARRQAKRSFRAMTSGHSCALINPGLQATESADARCAAMLERVHSLASSCTLAPACKVLLCLSGIGFRCAFTFCAKMCDFSRLCSGRKVTSWLGLVPVTVVKRRLPQAERHIEMRPQTLEGAPYGMCLGVREDKRCPASVDLHIRERARLLSKRLCTRRRQLLEGSVLRCRANIATAAEGGRFMLFLSQ
jgi:hypothetical protein